MPNKDRNIPKRRFKEFENEDAWELRKLGEVADVFDGTHQTPRYTNQGVMFLSVEDINTLESEKYISSEDFEKEFKIFPEFNDVLMTRIGDIGTSNIVKTNDKIAYYVSLALIKPKKLESHFLNSIIQSKDFQNELWKRTLHIAFPKKINKGEISEVNLKFPTLPEQKAIGTFFSTLDQQITLHQRKLDKLKHVKQAYLSEMFPAEGERVPKRRFPGFTDDWELRKLGELIDNLKGGVSITPNDYIENGYRTIPKGAVNDTGIADLSSCKNVSVDFFEKNYFSKTITGELITSLRDLVPSAPNLGRIVRIVGQFEEFIMPQGVYSLKTGENLLEDFLIAYSNCYIYRNVIQSEKNGSTQVHIRNGEFLNIKIQLPTLPEQKAIGTFFSTLDQQITLHQRKLEKLKNLKKALLNELFV
ncbi:TPA: restriction endonuclease subunit S [Streptococcus suis]